MASAPAAPAPDAKPKARRCWRCKEPMVPAATGDGERPRCGKCGTLQWLPA